MARKSNARRVAAADSLSNFAASLNTGKDKAAHDRFFVADIARDQIEAMYRGDWLARKIVDIVPYDSVRAWREWSGPRDAVVAAERAERRLNLRHVIQRAMILGRLYGGGAIVVGTAESDPAALAAPLYPELIGPGDVRFLHVVSRWQLGVSDINRNPLDPFYGEPSSYMLTSPERGELALHPSRVVRFFGNPLPDPLLYGAQVWSDSVLQTLYDAVHAVAVTAAGATSLVHEAKVDIVTVPNLSDHLSNAATTAQLSARFAYAAAMKSLNNLLLLGDGETWNRQSVDFGGLPQIMQTFLQIAAGAADIPVTRLLGQSPAGLSATGDSDTRNYYDMIAARQALDLRPQLERLDALMLRSAGVEPEALTFQFRPLWQLDASAKAAVALSKAQATAVYAGLNLWPTETIAALVRSQLLEDGTYPAAGAVLVPRPINESGSQPAVDLRFNLNQPRNERGEWTSSGTGRSFVQSKIISVAHVTQDPLNEEAPEEKEEGEIKEELKEQLDLIRGGATARPDGTISLYLPTVPFNQISNLGAGETSPAVISKPSGPAASSASYPIIPGVTAPGPFARDPIIVDANSRPSAAQKRQNTKNGYQWGCHWCGTKDPVTDSGEYIGDHQLPKALNPQGDPQRIYPHCQICSRKQGGYVRGMLYNRSVP